MKSMYFVFVLAAVLAIFIATRPASAAGGAPEGSVWNNVNLPDFNLGWGSMNYEGTGEASFGVSTPYQITSVSWALFVQQGSTSFWGNAFVTGKEIRGVAVANTSSGGNFPLGNSSFSDDASLVSYIPQPGSDIWNSTDGYLSLTAADMEMVNLQIYTFPDGQNPTLTNFNCSLTFNGDFIQPSLITTEVDVSVEGIPSQVPEPASLSVLAIGGICLLIRRRRA